MIEQILQKIFGLQQENSADNVDNSMEYLEGIKTPSAGYYPVLSLLVNNITNENKKY